MYKFLYQPFLIPLSLLFLAPYSASFGHNMDSPQSDTSSDQSLLVRYPRPLSDKDQRNHYPSQLLQLALSKVEPSYRLQASAEPMPQSRALNQLANNTEFDVVWSMTSKKREERLQPVRIPIYKGLIGWRVLLASDLSTPLSNTQALKDVLLIQGQDWPDTQILKSNEYRVHPASSYEGIFTMLSKGRADYFPRSVIEVLPELEAHQASGIRLEPVKLICYPAAFYYFVNREKKGLAQDIEQGLELAIADGSFDHLFDQHFAQTLEQLEVNSRHKIPLINPLLPPKTPLQRSELWFKGNGFKGNGANVHSNCSWSHGDSLSGPTSAN